MRVIEQAGGQAVDSFRKLFDELTFGALGGAAPEVTLMGSRAALEAANAQALSGDFTARGRIPDLVRSFIDASRAFNASGKGFVSDRARAIDIVSAFMNPSVAGMGSSPPGFLVPLPSPGFPLDDFLPLPGFAHGGSIRVGGFGGTDSQLVAFRATPGEQVRVGANDDQIVQAISAGGSGIARLLIKMLDGQQETNRHLADLEEENRRLRREMRFATEGMKKAS